MAKSFNKDLKFLVYLFRIIFKTGNLRKRKKRSQKRNRSKLVKKCLVRLINDKLAKKMFQKEYPNKYKAEY